MRSLGYFKSLIRNIESGINRLLIFGLFRSLTVQPLDKLGVVIERGRLIPGFHPGLLPGFTPPCVGVLFYFDISINLELVACPAKPWRRWERLN
jgi:hypothetical protein